MCDVSDLEDDAWCDFAAQCEPACLCVQPDPYSNGCDQWEDEWDCNGEPNPFGECGVN